MFKLLSAPATTATLAKLARFSTARQLRRLSLPNGLTNLASSDC
jgi:hypothetical protein